MSTVLIRDVNGNTLARVEVEGTPEPALSGWKGGNVKVFTNGEGWVVTLYQKEDE
jgi:hypothetical protein